MKIDGPARKKKGFRPDWAGSLSEGVQGRVRGVSSGAGGRHHIDSVTD